ncbi:MAG: DUF3795 domain-containing protein [Chloroflexota bacterium]|jgi:hypothetical protein|nr:DUF3795 domain-containing protein [Chloroflexota bacterium]
MEPIISLCGMRCDLCLAYRPNVEAHPENQQLLSDGWHKYFGFRLPPEDILCDGCFVNGESILDSECPVRPCVIDHNVMNCAECDNYVCEKLADILVDFDDFQAKFDQPIPEADRRRFIFPYENKQRLAELRKQK